MTRYAQVNVVVEYEANVEIPDGMETEEYVHEHWQDYGDDLIAQKTQRRIIETWDDEEDAGE